MRIYCLFRFESVVHGVDKVSIFLRDDSTSQLERVGEFAPLERESFANEGELLDLLERRKSLQRLRNGTFKDLKDCFFVDELFVSSRLKVIGDDIRMLAQGLEVWNDDGGDVRSSVANDGGLLDDGIELIQTSSF